MERSPENPQAVKQPADPVDAAGRVARAAVPADKPPRVWTALLAFPIAFLVFLAAQILAIGVVVFVAFGSSPPDLQAFLKSPALIAGVAAGQIALLIAVLAAAVLSPQPMVQRLGLNQPRCSWLLVVPMAVGTLFLGSLVMLALQLLIEEPPEVFQLFGDLISGAEGMMALALIGTIGILPGIAEEFLYRGYIQRRLTARWGGLAAILVANLFFALHHLDPVHMIAVFVLGLWLGFITWRTRSIWPAVICHCTNNTFAVALVLYAPELVTVPEEEWGAAAPLVSIGFLAVTGGALLYALIRLLRLR